MRPSSFASSVSAQRLQRSQQRYQAAPAFRVSHSPPCENFVSQVASRCGPAVVKVLTEHAREENEPDLSELLESLFGGGSEVFIGADGLMIGGDAADARGPQRERRRRKRRVMRGQGSGFFIDGATLLTNAHVVKGASAVKVLLTTGEQLIGDVRGLDSVLDVAVVQVAVPPGMQLPSIPLNDGGSLQVGQWTISMGNPLGLNNSVSLGVLSSLKPMVEASLDWSLHDYLQTDAAINTGNSGGPLLNERGEVIGIVTAKAGGMNTEGLGFAIPIGRVLPVIPSLIAGAAITHPMLGLQLTDVHTQAAELLREEYDLPPSVGTPGAMVVNVLPRSPADLGALKPGDLIVRANGRHITSAAHLQAVIASSRVGANASMELVIARGAGQRSVLVAPVDFEEYSEARKEEEKRRSPSRRLILMP
jgi:S1-C subfamily serine protease